MNLSKSFNTYFSQYLSVQAEWLSLQWQIDLLGKFVYEGHWENELKVKQCYFQKDFLENWDIMVGRVLLRWGTGYVFNPTDVIAPNKELSDPENIEKRAEGNDIAKLEYFGETYSIALCYLTRIDFNQKTKSEGPKLAFRFYKHLWGIDMSLISLFNKNESPIWGFNFSYVLGDRLEVHGEISSQRGNDRQYHRATQDEKMLYLEDPFVENRRNEKKYYNQYLLGFQYTFPGNIHWICEYYHQEQGYSKNEWDRIMSYVTFLNDQMNTFYRPLAEANLLWSLNVFSPKGAMQDYCMNYVSIPLFEKFEFRLTTLMNLTDFSFIFIPEMNLTFGNHFTFFYRSFIFQGRNQTEFGEFFQSYSIEGGLRLRL